VGGKARRKKMKDKEKLEEMANDLEEEFVLCGTLSNCGTKRCSRCFSKYLYEQGYRKIPEGSVVVSKQVWEEHIEKREKANKIFEERIRKETAREILQELYEQIDEKTPKWVETQIKMKAKQFGVEVDNDR
jgi:hypothetical protein